MAEFNSEMIQEKKLSALEQIKFLQEIISQTLARLIPNGTRVALLDYPNHANVGDNLIWLGEKASLRNLGAKVVYTCDYPTYSRKDLLKKIGDGVILLHGGGNIGDLWPKAQSFRERVLKDFPDHRVIQFPQAVYFQSERALENAKRILNGHPNLILMIRGRMSLEFMQREFETNNILCPDLALAVGSLESQQGITGSGILYLKRTDRESREIYPAEDCSISTKVDWIQKPLSFLESVNDFFMDHVRKHPRKLRFVRHLTNLYFDALASLRVKRGCQMLARGQVVITDRLHGAILSLLLGIPCWCLDNNYGKVKSLYDTWLSNCEILHWADSFDQAYEEAKSFISNSHFKRQERETVYVAG